MIVLDKAILHMMDMSQSSPGLSDAPLELSEELTEFLAGHLGKCMGKISSRPGEFQPAGFFRSRAEEYIAGGDFVAFSKDAAKIWFDALKEAEEVPPSGLFVCDFGAEGVRYLALLRIGSKKAFFQRVTEDGGGTRNDIEARPSVPASGAEESALIRAEDMALFVTEKKFSVDGNRIALLSEAVLESVLGPSPQETVTAIRKTAEKVAKDFGIDPVKTSASVKRAIAEELSEDENLDPIKTGLAVFGNAPDMEEAFRKKMGDAGFIREEPVKVDRQAIMKKVENQKLKTDTGIELSIPAAYFDNTEYIEFNRDEDGSLSITLKHIGSLVNRG